MVHKPIKFDAMGGGGMGGYSQMFAGGAQSTVGLYQVFAAYGALKKLQKKPIDEYRETPELKASRLRAEENARYGFTPEQKATFFQNLATLNNQRYNRGVQAGGGNLSQSVLAGVQYGNINALNNFQSQDADRKLRNIQYADSFARGLQQLRNMQTQQNIQQRLEKERALGAAINSGVQNFVGGAQTFAGSTAPYSNPDATQQRQQVPQSWQDQVNSNYMQGNDNQDPWV